MPTAGRDTPPPSLDAEGDPVAKYHKFCPFLFRWHFVLNESVLNDDLHETNRNETLEAAHADT
jgi:hypothetical protein